MPTPTVIIPLSTATASDDIARPSNCWVQVRVSRENTGVPREMRLSEQRRPARIAGERLFWRQQYHGIPVFARYYRRSVI